MNPLSVTEIFWRADCQPNRIDPRDAAKVRLGEGRVSASRLLVIGGCRLADGRLLIGHPEGEHLLDAGSGAAWPWRGTYGVFAELAQHGEDAEGLIVTRQDWYGVVDYGLLLGADQPYAFVGAAQRAVEARFRDDLGALLGTDAPDTEQTRPLCRPTLFWGRFRHEQRGDGYREVATPLHVMLVNGRMLPIENGSIRYPVPLIGRQSVEELPLALVLSEVVSRAEGGWQAHPLSVRPHPLEAMLDLQLNACRQLANAMQALVARCEGER